MARNIKSRKETQALTRNIICVNRSTRWTLCDKPHARGTLKIYHVSDLPAGDTHH